ncbi:mechanosensitive ion channel family protein [Aurantimonas coralicida]|uniref:mechanosensitive ion channel family protein n=1 Tax=Aurantimonas coralicida TaxID=182270 RepID=UPI001E6554CF|nr:mechanosensitive ion channel domain-containing protein [Aurantimonas coralicida]MCD1642718.1 mechanosensitive ion channel family protein [Aurantimonas coralicida]
MRLLAVFLILLATLAGADAQDSAPTRYYEIDTLNSGLPPAEAYIGHETPQGMMESFVAAANARNWEMAAHMLDLSDIDPALQAEMGPVLAKRMFDIAENGMWLDWGDLSDRPDAMATNVAAENPMAGEPRRNIRLAILELPDRPVSVRIARVKPADGEPVWLFSRQTVGNILALHEIYGPTRFEQSLPGFLRERAFWTLAWWEVVALPLVLLIAIGAAFLVHAWVGRVKWRQPSRIARRILDSIQMPVALMACVGTFSLVNTLLFTFSGAVNRFLTPLQSTLFVIALAMIGVRIVDAVLDRVVQRNVEALGDSEAAEQRDLYTNISAARRVAIVLALGAGVSLVLIQTNAFESLGFSLLASAGVIGLVLAFAARSVLANIMASLQIALAKTARIGDAVLYDDQWCYVEKINFTYIQLQTWDNRRLIVPVNELVSHTFENWTKQDSSITKIVALRLDHRADVDRLREAFQEFVQNDEDVINRETADVYVVDQDRSGMLVWFLAAASDPSTGWTMQCRLRETMLKAVVRLEAENGGPGTDRAVYLPREREELVAAVDPRDGDGSRQAAM